MLSPNDDEYLTYKLGCCIIIVVSVERYEGGSTAFKVPEQLDTYPMSTFSNQRSSLKCTCPSAIEYMLIPILVGELIPDQHCLCSI